MHGALTLCIIMTSRHLLIIITLCAAIFSATAQRFKTAIEPVIWKAEVTRTDGKKATVALTADVAKGWHLYDLTLPEGGPKPTVIDLSANKGVRLDGKITPSVKPVKIHDEMFNMELTQWDTPVTFTIPLKLEGKGAHKVEIKVVYMTCDGNNCRPPKTEILTVTIP